MSLIADQGWLQDRCGKVTASCFANVMARPKSGTGEATTRRDYRLQLAVERLTGVPSRGYENDAMRWGNATEADAREAFELATGLMVETTGFIDHPTVALCGCSPDGLIGRDEGLEIKCPYSSVIHIQTILKGMPPKHKAQVQGCLWVTGRDRWHFVSFDPRMPEPYDLYHQIIPRDDAFIRLLADEVARFQDDIQSLLMDMEKAVTDPDYHRYEYKGV